MKSSATNAVFLVDDKHRNILQEFWCITIFGANVVLCGVNLRYFEVHRDRSWLDRPRVISGVIPGFYSNVQLYRGSDRSLLSLGVFPEVIPGFFSDSKA